MSKRRRVNSLSQLVKGLHALICSFLSIPDHASFAGSCTEMRRAARCRTSWPKRLAIRWPEHPRDSYNAELQHAVDNMGLSFQTIVDYRQTNALWFDCPLPRYIRRLYVTDVGSRKLACIPLGTLGMSVNTPLWDVGALRNFTQSRLPCEPYFVGLIGKLMMVCEKATITCVTSGRREAFGLMQKVVKYIDELKGGYERIVAKQSDCLTMSTPTMTNRGLSRRYIVQSQQVNRLIFVAATKQW